MHQPECRSRQALDLDGRETLADTDLQQNIPQPPIGGREAALLLAFDAVCAIVRPHRDRMGLPVEQHDRLLGDPDAGPLELAVDRRLAATDWRPGEVLLQIRIGERLATVQIERLTGAVFRLMHGGVIRRAQVLLPRAAELLALMPEKQASDTSRLLLSPMPGLLSSVAVTQGQEVKAGEPLAVVEAMKMENILRAERDGRIARIRANPGDSLTVDQVILEFE